MYFEYKNFVGDNNSIIDIVADDSAFGLLKKSDLDTLKVCLPLSLSKGKYESITPMNRNNVLEHDDIESYDFTSDFNKLKNIVDKNKTIRVWFSEKSIDEYRFLLLICYMFKDYNISIVDINKIDAEAFAVGCLSNNQIKDIDEITTILTDKEKDNYSNEWLEIANSNLD